MSFAEIAGQAQVKRFLQGNLRNDTISHAYLFSGPRGAGKLAMARTFAQAMYCETMVDDACGECLSCRRFAHRNLVGYIEIGLQKNKQSISIDQIRELQHQLSFRAEAHHQKIYVVHEAHTLNLKSANSMLKFLEEPGKEQIAILLTHNERTIPATVLSRVQMVKFNPLNPAELLQQVIALPYDMELKRLAVQLSGDAERAHQLLAAEWFAEYRNLVIELVQVALKQPYLAVITLQQRLTKLKPDAKKSLDLLAQMLELMFRDLVYCACQRSEQIVFTEQRHWLQTHAMRRELRYWIECTEQILTIRRKRVVNTNWQMLLEQFFIRLKER